MTEFVSKDVVFVNKLTFHHPELGKGWLVDKVELIGIAVVPVGDLVLAGFIGPIKARHSPSRQTLIK